MQGTGVLAVVSMKGKSRHSNGQGKRAADFLSLWVACTAPQPAPVSQGLKGTHKTHGGSTVFLLLLRVREQKL